MLLFLCSNDSVLVFLLSTLIVIILFRIDWYFHLFVRLYKPLQYTVDLSFSFWKEIYGPLFFALIFSLLSPLSLTFLVAKHPPRMTTWRMSD